MFFIDVQGTLIDDINKQPIDGSIDIINRLNREEIPYIVVTNNTKEESRDFLHYLNSIGFNIPKERYLDPLMVLDKILTSNRLLAFGVDGFLNTLKKRGYDISSDNPTSILLGVKNNYTFEEFSTIIETILKNQSIDLIGMHGTSIYSKGGKRYPGVGAVLEMLKFATGVDYQVVGKPSHLFYREALHMMGENDFKKITMVSDDFKGDLVGAKQLGMKTILVLSGKIKSADEVAKGEELKPDLITESIARIEI